MTQNKARGFTLLELIVTLSISCILFLFCHHLHVLMTSLSNECDAHRFYNTLTFARVAAIKGNQLITVCPTIDQKQCSNDWSTGYMVFYQQSPQHPIEVLRYEKNSHHSRFQHSSTSQIQFTGEGRCLHRATFQLESQKPCKIVVYDSGRIRLSHVV